MVLRFLLKDLDVFLGKIMWIVIVVFSVYSLMLANAARIQEIDYWEFVLIAVSDHYYVLYFMVPCFIFSLLKQRKDDDDLTLIRMRNYSRYFAIVQMSTLLMNSIVFVLLHFLIVMIIGVGLDNRDVFTAVLADSFLTESLNGYRNVFLTPCPSALLSGLYMVAGYLFLGVLVRTIQIFFLPRITLLFISIGYLTMIFSLFTNMDIVFPYIFLNNYILLHHGINSLGAHYMLLVVVEIAMILGVIYFVGKYWYKEVRTLSQKLSFNLVKIKLAHILRIKTVFFLTTITMVMPLSKLLQGGEVTFHDLLTLQFWGHGIGYFDFYNMMAQVVLNGAPIYILCSFVQNECADCDVLSIIRARSIRNWFRAIVMTSVIFIFLYVAVMIAVTYGLSDLFEAKHDGFKYYIDSFNANFTEPITDSRLIAKVLGAKVLELMLMFLVVLLLYSFTHEMAFCFFVAHLSYALCIANGGVIKYFPIGLGSLSRWEDFVGNNGISYSEVVMTLLCFDVIIYNILLRYRHKIVFAKNMT